jgi:hypothetical protein
LGLGPDFILTGLSAGASEVSDFDNSEMFRFREGVRRAAGHDNLLRF